MSRAVVGSFPLHVTMSSSYRMRNSHLKLVADVAEAGPGAAGGAAAALLAEPGRTTTRSAARHDAGETDVPKPDAKDTVLEGN